MEKLKCDNCEKKISCYGRRKLCFECFAEWDRLVSFNPPSGRDDDTLNDVYDIWIEDKIDGYNCFLHKFDRVILESFTIPNRKKRKKEEIWQSMVTFNLPMKYDETDHFSVICPKCKRPMTIYDVFNAYRCTYLLVCCYECKIAGQRKTYHEPHINFWFYPKKYLDEAIKKRMKEKY